MRKKWDDEIVDWLRENVPGRTTKEIVGLINRQGFDKKYGIVVANHFFRPQINLIVCHKINRYNDINIEKEKVPRHFFSA